MMLRKLALILSLVWLPNAANADCVLNTVGTAGTAISGDNITMGAPASPLTDDVWIAVVATNAAGATHTFTDWTNIVDTNPTSTQRFSVWYHRYAGVTPNLIVSVGGTSGATSGQIAQLRGCKNSGSPVDTLGTSTDALDNNTATFAAITPTATNTLLLAVWAYTDDLNVTTGPSGFSSGFVLTSSNNGVYLYHKAHTSGDTGGFTATMTADGNNDDVTARLIAIAPLVSTRRRGGYIILN